MALPMVCCLYFVLPLTSFTGVMVEEFCNAFPSTCIQIHRLLWRWRQSVHEMNSDVVRK